MKENTFEESMDPELLKMIREGTASNEQFWEQFNKCVKFYEFENKEFEEEELEVPEKY